MRRLALLLAVLSVGALAALAQTGDDDQTEDNGFLVNLLQNTLSAPGRQIGLEGIEGALSSTARIARITVSDETGPWLEITNVAIDWNRLQLLLGRVNVNSLTADSIDLIRRPVFPPAPPLPDVAAEPFSVPDLPVSVRVQELGVGAITLAEEIVGQAAELSLSGRLTLAGGDLDTALELVRTDRPGGRLDLAAAFSNESRQLAIDLDVNAPGGGLLSQIVTIEGDPDLALTVAGEGPISDVTVAVALDADGTRVAGGDITLLETEEGQSFDVDLSGAFAPLVPTPYRDFFAGDTAVRATGVSKTEGGVRLDTLAVNGAELTLDGRLETGAGNGLQSLRLTGSLGDPAGPPVVLPVPGGDTTLNAATLYVNFGQSSRWDGLVVLDRLSAGQMAFEDITLDMGGLARDLDDPDQRLVTVTLEGIATGITSTDPAIDRALGPRLDLFADLQLPATGPITLEQFQIAGEGLSVFSAGDFEDGVFTGRAALRAPDLVVLSGLANRPLAGAAELRAEGSVTPLTGAFDLTLDGRTDRITLGDPRLDALLAGETEISGRAVRDAEGLRTEDLSIENPQLRLASDGTISLDRTDFALDAEIFDIGLDRSPGGGSPDAHRAGQRRGIAGRAGARCAAGERPDPRQRRDGPRYRLFGIVRPGLDRGRLARGRPARRAGARPRGSGFGRPGAAGDQRPAARPRPDPDQRGPDQCGRNAARRQPGLPLARYRAACRPRTGRGRGIDRRRGHPLGGRNRPGDRFAGHRGRSRGSRRGDRRLRGGYRARGCLRAAAHLRHGDVPATFSPPASR